MCQILIDKEPHVNLFAAALLLLVGPAPDTKEQALRLAAFMSGEYRDSAGITRERVSGNRTLLKTPYPPALPLRTAQAVKDVATLDDPALRDTAASACATPRCTTPLAS